MTRDAYDNGTFHGLEWAYTCGKCGEQSELSGWGYIGNAEVDGKRRVTEIEAGSRIECPHCGHTVILRFEDE